MGSLPSYVGAFLLLVGPLVLIHEFGHFATAKLLGIKVVRFSFGFGPRLFGFRRGETDYRVSLLPLGGYVKMAGDNPAEVLEPADRGRGFLEAAPWKRAAIAFAGPAMNLMLPALVFFLIAIFATHEGLLPVVGAVQPDSPAAKAGMQPGDKILSVDQTPIATFEDLRDAIGERAGQPLQVRVQRGGNQLPLTMVPERLEESDDIETTHRAVIGIRPLAPPATIGLLSPGAAAAGAGLKTFDRIVKVGDQPINDALELQAALEDSRHKTEPTIVTVARGQALGYPGLGPGLLRVFQLRLPVETHPDAPGSLPWGLHSADQFVRWVIPGSPAALAGIRIGDKVEALDGRPLTSWWDLENHLTKLQLTPFKLTVQTPGGPPREVAVAQALLDLGESPVTGIDVKALGLGLLHEGEPLLPTDQAFPRDWIFPTAKRTSYSLSLASAAERSVGATGEIIRKEVLGILRIFQGRVSVKKLGGPILIADVARQAAANGLAAFLFMMTLVSVNLGLMNLLPLPALDGGHIVTSFVEILQRKPLSRRAYELTNAFGFALIVALMVFVLVNDIVQKRAGLP